MKHQLLSSSPSFILSGGSGIAFEQQIVDQLPELIRSGEISPGTRLPAVHELAGELLVSPGTIRRAFRRLEEEGLVIQVSGQGRFIVKDAAEVLRQRSLDRNRSELSRAIAEIRNLHPGMRDDLEVEADHLRRAIEIDQAREMQVSLLPQTPPRITGLDIAVSMNTASEVGGDYFDFFPHPPDGVRAVVGDATGHGMAAGIMAAMTKACLTAIDSGSPQQTMARANEVLRVVRGRRVMMALGIIEVEPGRATVCSAAMPPVYVLRNASATVEEVVQQSLPLGSALADSFPCTEIALAPGDALIALTDGFPEARNARGEALGSAPIRACLASRREACAKEVVADLRALATAWSGGYPVEDDQTALVIRWNGGPAQ